MFHVHLYTQSENNFFKQHLKNNFACEIKIPSVALSPGGILLTSKQFQTW